MLEEIDKEAENVKHGEGALQWSIKRAVQVLDQRSRKVENFPWEAKLPTMLMMMIMMMMMMMMMMIEIKIMR